MSIVTDHLERLRTTVLGRHSMATLADWIVNNTFLGGRPYSYDGHEFQKVIASDTSQEVNVRKCSQVGVSELSGRLALAMTNVVSPLTAIYSLPTAHFAATFMKTRIDPVIASSKVLKQALNRNNDTGEIKQFGDSFLYLRGAASTNAPISIPADVIINDEQDFCDQEVLTQYMSRLTHSKWKIIRRFSTPTLPGYGVDKSFQESRRHFNLVKCHHCNHHFLPDYYQHVRVPGFTGDLRAITKVKLSVIEWQDAYVECPRCGKEPSLLPEHREYVCENPRERLIGAGYQVSPFDAPTIIKPSDLIRASTGYARAQDFVNFSLGLPMEDSEATLTRSDFLQLFIDSETSAGAMHVMGVDVGNTYHFVVSAVDPFGNEFVVHKEQVPMGQAKERYRELRARFRVVCTVIDSGPHAETVMALQAEDPNCYAAVYTKNKGVLTHTVIDKEQCAKEGKAFVRQVNVNRNRAFDAYMNHIRDNKLTIRSCDLNDTFVTHHTDMKRVKLFDTESGEMSYSWQKNTGEDHFHHAGLYCFIAGRIKGVGRSLVQLPLFSAMKFAIKDPAPIR